MSIGQWVDRLRIGEAAIASQMGVIAIVGVDGSPSCGVATRWI